MVTVTSFYAGLLALLFVVLSARVIRSRRSQRVSLGDGENADLQARIRAQGNCAEYTPLGLLLLALAELQGAPALALHVLGLALLAGRCLHGYGLSQTPQNMRARVLGMALTLNMIGVTGLGLVLHALF